MNASGSLSSEFTTDASGAAGPTPRTITGGAESAERKQELGRLESGGGDLQAAVLNWPTPTSLSFADSHQPGNCYSHNKMMDLAATIWSTPRASDGEKGGPNQAFGAGGVPLAAQTLQWSTPSVADVTGGRTSRSGDRKDELLLNSMAAYVSQNSWPTPTSLNRPRSEETLQKCGDYRAAKANQTTVPLYLEEVALASSLPALETAPDGPTSSPERRSLNPLFVEWLMGWPTGWTASECSATASSRFKARMRSALSRQPWPTAAAPAQLSLFG
jgi:hypothetical protein